MWSANEDPFKPGSGMLDRYTPGGAVRIDLPATFTGDGSQSFLSWARQLEVAVGATAGGGHGCTEELVRILPTRLGKSAFLLWDSLSDATKSDYAAIKERLGAAFGQRQLMDRFRASLSARVRASGESLEVYAADVSRLVAEAFPDYGGVAQREEKFRRFLAGLDPALKAKCLEMGATDLEEALHVAERCENARVALQNDYVSTAAAAYGGGSPSVQSVSVSDGLQRAVEKLTEDMRTMRVGMKELYEENRRLRAGDTDTRGRRFRSPSGGCCNCTCGEWGCQLRGSREEHRGRSPEPGRSPRQGGFPSRGYRSDPSGMPSRPPGGRSPSPNWRARREDEPRRREDEPRRREDEPRRRGVHFLPRQQDADNGHQGNGR